MHDVRGYIVFMRTVSWYHFLVKILVRELFRENKISNLQVRVSLRARREGIWGSGGVVPLVRNLFTRRK